MNILFIQKDPKTLMIYTSLYINFTMIRSFDQKYIKQNVTCKKSYFKLDEK